MQTLIWMSILVIALIVVGVSIVVAVAMQKSSAKSDPANQGKHPRGYWMSMGISTGVGIGVAVGVAMENIGAGIAVGIAIGSGIGASLEQKNIDKTRPLTEQENKIQRRGVAVGLIMLLIFAGIFILLLFLRIR